MFEEENKGFKGGQLKTMAGSHKREDRVSWRAGFRCREEARWIQERRRDGCRMGDRIRVWSKHDAVSNKPRCNVFMGSRVKVACVAVGYASGGFGCHLTNDVLEQGP